MGQKVNPIGLRLGKQKKWVSNWFNSFQNYEKFLHKNFLINEYIKNLFKYNFNKNHIIVKTSLIKTEENKLYYIIFFYRLRSKLVLNKSLKQNLVSQEKNYKNFTGNNFLLKHQNKKIKVNFNYNKFLKIKCKSNLLSNYKLKYNLAQTLNILLCLIKLNSGKENFVKTYLNKKLFLKIDQLNRDFNLKLILALKNNDLLSITHYKSCIKNISLLKHVIYLNNLLKYDTLLKNEKFLKLAFNFIFNFKTKKELFKNLINDELSHELNVLSRLIFLNKEEKAYTFLNKLNLEDKKNVLSFLFRLILLNQKNLFEKNLISSKNQYNLNIINLLLNELVSSSFQLKNNFFVKSSFQLKHLTNSNIQLLYINCLSFLKYQALLNKTNVNRLLTLEKSLTRFYRARFKLSLIQQFIYGGYISVFFKNPELLGKIIVEGLETLPKFRKHGQYFKFLSDIINALINSQKEIVGFRIKLKGRFNKWRRTKSVYINRGRLPLRIHDSKISYSSSYGCIRRGLFGVKIWICYDKDFSNKLEFDLKNYLLYSKNKQNVIKTK